MQDSPGLHREISNISFGKDPKVEFHNGSWIQTVTANDGARGKRSNCLIMDEFRMIDQKIINNVLRKFSTAPRSPKFLSKPEYAHMIERNQEIYLSSAWYKFHWSYERLLAYFKSMVDGRKYFVCGLPYQIAIKENLLNRQQVEDEMAEADFSPVDFQIEMECIFYGESDKAYFNFEEIIKNRQVPRPLYPKDTYKLLRDSKFKSPTRKDGEIRLLSCDIAAMGGNSNDASAFSVIQLIPTSNGYNREVTYIETLNGGHLQAQAIRIRQLYHDFDIDYIVLDTQGVGLGVFDLLVIPLVDKERGIEYEPISCINDKKMADRCTYPQAKEVIYSIKAGKQINSEAAISVKDDLTRGRLRLLTMESDGREYLNNMKGYFKLPEEIKAELELPYIQTSLLSNEMIGLEGSRDPNTGYISVKEQSGNRKDRYSSIAYGNYIANQLERENITSKREIDISDYMYFMHDGF